MIKKKGVEGQGRNLTPAETLFLIANYCFYPTCVNFPKAISAFE